MKECCQPGRGQTSNPDHQSNAHPTEPPRPAKLPVTSAVKRLQERQELIDCVGV